MKLMLVLLLSLSSAYADEMTLHLFRSPLGISWKSPFKLATSTLANQIAPVGDKRASSMAHVFIELKCDSKGRHIYRGMTSLTSTEERDLLFKQKYGLGIMFHTYKGLYEKEDTILKDMAPYAGNARKAELSYKVSPETCQRLMDYADEYESLGYGNMYSGLQADPLKREGSGCSAFAVSFLRVGGLMDDFTSQWKQIINVPNRFVGGPLTQKKVDLFYILSRPGARWYKSEPNIYLEAWDPELMHKWVKQTYQAVESGDFEGPTVPEISREGKTFRVTFDYSDRPTPVGSFWLN